MKYKWKDKVRIKSKKELECISEVTDDMLKNGGAIMTIACLVEDADAYIMKEDGDFHFLWSDEMIEGLVEEEFEVDLIPKFGEYSDNEPLDIPTMTTEFVKEHGLPCPEGYIFKDENGNVINAMKIVLEKKPDDKLKLESTKKVREYWSEYTRIYIEIYDDDPNECVLTHLYTFEGHRQKGYGKQALIQAEEIAKELGCHKAHLKVETNSWMHNWYLRCGYQWYKNADEGYTWLTKSI